MDPALLLEQAKAAGEQGRWSDALSLIQRRMAIGGRDVIGFEIGMTCAARLGEFNTARRYGEMALQIAPDAAMIRTMLGMVQLTLGEFDAGWANYLARLHMLEYSTAPLADVPFWRGEDLCDKRLRLIGEQGLGDVLMFARYIPLLKDQCRELTVAVKPPLLRLLRRTWPEVAFFDITAQDLRMPDADVCCWFIDVAAVRGDALTDPVLPPPYLVPDPDEVSAWRTRLSQRAGRKIGLCWAGNPAHLNNANRSISLAEFLPLFQLPDLHFVSLQKGPGTAQLAPLPDGFITDETDQLTDLADTAALISALDLVITVDTSVAHLSGALGKSVWLLCPTPPDWRWGEQGERQAWYPHMRVFRQPSHGNWTEVFERVEGALGTYS